MGIENLTLVHFSSLLTIFLSTTVESALQIHLFLTNEPNFRKSQMNVTSLIIKECSKWTLGQLGKTNPKQSQFKAKQTQYKPKQSQYNTALRLFAVGSRTEKIMLFKGLSGKFQLIFAILSDKIF